MPYKDPDYQKKYRERNREKNKEKRKEYYEKNKEKNKEKRDAYDAKRYEDRKQNAIDSISSGEIIDKKEWDMWCREIKRHARENKHPFSADFTNDIMFEMMVQGCFYCGDIATTVDRVDSKLEHTPGNCVGSCKGCNNSKGAADLPTFIRKAYYRAREKYYDDDIDIWFVNKRKPKMSEYRIRAKTKGVSFDLPMEHFEDLIKGDCKYCKRSPITWFGIDRVIPSEGYVLGNVVSCCFDCNVDKLVDDVETMVSRNERIAVRMDAGELAIYDCEKVILHNGISPTSKKVCVSGKVYSSMSVASRTLNMSIDYVGYYIRDETHPDKIFEITDDFYDEYKDSENITKDMFIAFEHFYTNM